MIRTTSLKDTIRWTNEFGASTFVASEREGVATACEEVQNILEKRSGEKIGLISSSHYFHVHIRRKGNNFLLKYGRCVRHPVIKVL